MLQHSFHTLVKLVKKTGTSLTETTSNILQRTDGLIN